MQVIKIHNYSVDKVLAGGQSGVRETTQETALVISADMK